MKKNQELTDELEAARIENNDLKQKFSLKTPRKSK